MTVDRRTDLIQEARLCLLAGSTVQNSSDPADALVILLSGPLSEMHGEVFTSNGLAERANAHFGWQLSSDAIEFFVPKMRTLGWLDSRTSYPLRGPFYVNLPEPEISSNDELDTREALAELGTQFLQFVHSTFPSAKLPDSPEEAGVILLRYVVDANLPVMENAQKEVDDEHFIAARFIDHADREKLDITRTIASLSAVGYLLRVADEISKPRKKRNIDFRLVVDGPIILDYLGCSGLSRKHPIQSLFKRLRDHGASLVTFQHCVIEARDVLRSVLRTAPRDRYGPTGDALRKGCVNETVMNGLLQAFEASTRAAGIEILPDNTQFMPQSKQYCSDKLASEIEGIVNWHDSDNDNARYADSNTAILILRRRRGYRTSDLFTSKFVCVTSNDRFAGSIKRFLREKNYYSENQVPPVVTLRELSAKLWIDVGPTDAAARIDLPNSQLLYACNNALRFNRQVVEKAREELKKVRPDQLNQFEILLEVPRSARAVMDLTFNDERNVTSGNISLLVEAAIEAAGEEVGRKAKEQRLRDSEQYKARLEKINTDLTAERQRAFLAEERAKQTEADRICSETRVRSNDETMLNAVAERATTRFRVARIVIRAAGVLVALVPLISAAVIVIKGHEKAMAIIIVVIGALLAAAAAMDRPGTWLSGLIQGRLHFWARKQLQAVGRHDLSSKLVLSWSNGKADVQVDDVQEP